MLLHIICRCREIPPHVDQYLKKHHLMISPILDKIALFQKLNIVLRGTDRGSSWQYDTRKVAQTVQSVCYKNHLYASRE